MKKDRRTILIGMGAGLTALPIKWAKPVINCVILPAHAQTSPCQVGEWRFDIYITRFEPIGEPPVQYDPPAHYSKILMLDANDVSGDAIHRYHHEGSIPAADWQDWYYKIKEKTCSTMSGDYHYSSVDVGDDHGYWSAIKL